MEPQRLAASATRHELFVADGDMSMRWKMADFGVTLASDSMSWTVDELPRQRPYSEIFSIRIQRAAAGTAAGVGICQIRFRDGTIVNIFGGNEYGAADDVRAPLYAAFVRDLHMRLAGRDDCKLIDYQAGLSQARYIILSVLIVAAGLLFFLTPLVLLIMIRDLHTLGVFAAGAGLFWSFYQLWEKGRPRAYSPQHLPDELL